MGQVALLSLIPIVALGIVLASVLQGQIVSRTLADATQSASLVARLGVQPRISPSQLEHGLNANGIRALDEQLHARSVTHDLARIKIWNNEGLIVYSDDHRLIGQRPGESDELKNALAGRPNAAAVVTPSHSSETASEVGLGRLVEVYVPLRFTAYTPCFRAEAGAAGKDTRGMIRMHQFAKVELVSITTPDQSQAEHERMTDAAQEILKQLNLAHRVVTLCPGDMGFGAQKT